MYGGSGISPSSSSAASNVPSHSKSTIRPPASVVPAMWPTSRPSPNVTDAPGRSFLPGRTSASQRFGASCLSSSTSHAPPPARTPYSRAGMTRVSLTTSASPGFK